MIHTFEGVIEHITRLAEDEDGSAEEYMAKYAVEAALEAGFGLSEHNLSAHLEILYEGDPDFLKKVCLVDCLKKAIDKANDTTLIVDEVQYDSQMPCHYIHLPGVGDWGIPDNWDLFELDEGNLPRLSGIENPIEDSDVVELINRDLSILAKRAR